MKQQNMLSLTLLATQTNVESLISLYIIENVIILSNSGKNSVSK